MITININIGTRALPQSFPINGKKSHNADARATMRLHKSVRRSKNAVKKLILTNDFHYLATFTSDRRKDARFDTTIATTLLQRWLRLQRTHSPNLQYLIIPAYRDDGSLLYHCLLTNFNGRLTDTKQIKNNQKVYTFSGYRSGDSTAIEIEINRGELSDKMCQLINKRMPLMMDRLRFISPRLQSKTHH